MEHDWRQRCGEQETGGWFKITLFSACFPSHPWIDNKGRYVKTQTQIIKKSKFHRGNGLKKVCCFTDLASLGKIGTYLVTGGEGLPQQ